MTSELAPLFEPIAARFDVQSQAIAQLRVDHASLAAEVQRLRSAPPPPQCAPPPPPSSMPDAGWTAFPPSAAGARVVHVSSSAGRPTNTGLSPDSPVDSLARGVALLRDGAGDRLLLRCGDTFRESFGGWTKSGRSPDQPLLIASYGDGQRPRVVSPGTALNILSTEVHDLALVGLHLTAAGRDPALPDFDPASPASHGVRVVRPVTNLLIEDCRVEFFGSNLTLTAGDVPGAKLSNIRVRRCQVLDAWSTAGAFTAQGLYASGCDGLLIEENVFDHNGWSETIPGAVGNIFRHNLYLSAANANVIVRGNVIARAASHGLQLRGGGVIEDNLFLDNALHCLLAGAAGRFRRNAVLGGRDLDADNPRGFGVTLACADGRADRNLLAQKPQTAGPALSVQRNDWTPPGPMHAAFVANVVHGWNGNAVEITGDCDLLEFAGNDLRRLFAGRRLFNVKAKVGRYLLAANRYDSAEPRERWFAVNATFVAPDRWPADTGDSSVVESMPDPDPPPALPPDYLSTVRNRPRAVWNPAASAAAVSRTLREAFED